MKKILVLLGPPGVGKGTVGTTLAKTWNLPLISSGDILRESVKNGSPLGLEARAYMERGELVPDELVLSLIRERIARDDSVNGFIFDGFPRNLKQAEILETLLDGNAYFAVYLKAGDEFLVRRLANRRVCSNCGAIYHLINMPPRKDGACNTCGAALIQREDDRPDVIMKRLEVYRVQTEPLLDFYRSRGLLHEVSGEQQLAETFSHIRSQLAW